MLDLIILFICSLLAATIFPAQSEIILASLYLTNLHNSYILLSVATAGNVLGSIINWYLGYYLIKFKEKKWFPIKGEKKLNKYTKIYKKCGIVTLLFAWLPIVGDIFTLIAGVLRVNIWIFIFLVTIGKALRYLVILSII